MKRFGAILVSGLIVTAGAVWVNGAAFSQETERGSGMGQGMGKGMGQGMGQGMGGGHGMMGKKHGPGYKGNRVRHRVIRMGGGVPAPYTDAENPLPANDEHIKAGETLFVEQCASCHGMSGKGDGEAGRELSPKPANIAYVMKKRIATDPFLFWSISEGGAPLKTAMPAFKDTLSDQQRWQIIHYLRSDFGEQN